MDAFYDYSHLEAEAIARGRKNILRLIAREKQCRPSLWFRIKQFFGGAL